MNTRLAAVFLATSLATAALVVPALGAGSGASLRDNFFVPKRLVVNRGTTVTWRWRGDNEHNVTVRRGPVRFHSSTKSAGTFGRRLTKPGTYRIVCTIHEFSDNMRMTVVVR
jgi:plastocyanin